MPKLGCLGVKGCDAKTPRIHFTCIYCRTRRRLLGKYKEPRNWIFYTYLSWWAINYVKQYVENGKIYSRSDGGWLKVEHPYTLHIDPRGHFTMIRCAIIILLDRYMLKHGSSYSKIVRNTNGEVTRIGYAHGLRKPWAEICEFLANYPTW